MKNSSLLKVNEPNIVHETIDGETILLDLNTGNYYSLDGPGAIIWEFIVKTGDWQKPIRILSASSDNQQNQIKESVTAFVKKLLAEKLLVELEGEVPEGHHSELETELREAGVNFVPPKVNKYSDMQDLLLLDPIHEVDETGWPESPDHEDEETDSKEII